MNATLRSLVPPHGKEEWKQTKQWKRKQQTSLDTAIAECGRQVDLRRDAPIQLRRCDDLCARADMDSIPTDSR